MSRFQDKVVFITGGTSGLGFETAQLFIHEGAKVFITDLEERSILERLPTPEDCEAAIKACIKHYGRLDILFHNAGLCQSPASVVDQDPALYQKIINTNLFGYFYLAKFAIPQMEKQGKGAIIATASMAGVFGDYGFGSYGSSKAGIINLTRTMALDHAGAGIRVNCVCPGLMLTPMVAPITETPMLLELLEKVIPMGRGAHPGEVAKVVAFLASDDASYITGQAIIADGGLTASSGQPNFLKVFAEMQVLDA
ncbi:hypothetical protein LTR13_004823 [Exophiala sideris]|nr:hypothetical protein LTR13_004823 [Exophiala sideris]